MRFGPFLAILLGVLALGQPLAPLAIMPAMAQQAEEMPPMPRPRPDPDARPTIAPPAISPDSPATEAIDAITSAPQPVTLTAIITPDSPPITEGLIWRIFDATPDASGEIAMAAKSDEGTAKLSLPPGEYLVHIAYGRAQISDTLSVTPGDNQKTYILEAGALRLNAAVTGDIPIPPNLLSFEIFTSGDEATRTPIAQGVQANEIVTINSGTYHVVSHFGAINAVVRADLQVEPGQLTDATLYHLASQISFKLVSEAGGEAIADVDWTVKTADGATIFTELGAFPTTVLAEGTYLVLAKQGDQVFNREFEVKPGPPQDIEVLTTAY
ncbi:hypothetical protein GCM10007913_11050 [Devosia yakushimensis]|uniref:Carboxypeptidase regulatory-like domain-containing protein n=1 Tax=Devosia yakushimensis TaxID=470028 RepID=A0ABQ5UB33_9HYPH|nr:hypothetical protein [Devosia yakushimensis]GLQ09173.1 hypothetical protein GCM10007913_11050 [Devosia yakushimensis]